MMRLSPGFSEFDHLLTEQGGRLIEGHPGEARGEGDTCRRGPKETPRARR